MVLVSLVGWLNGQCLDRLIWSAIAFCCCMCFFVHVVLFVFLVVFLGFCLFVLFFCFLPMVVVVEKVGGGVAR